MATKKGMEWTPEEDAKLIAAVEAKSCHDCPNHYRADCPCKTFTKKKTWDDIAKPLKRTHGGVQGRWCSVLDPKLDKSDWTLELDEKLLKLYKDRNFPSWSERARALSAPGLRRNGGDVAKRYFDLLKQDSRKSIGSSSSADQHKRRRKTPLEEDE
jgi:hypothetical protein